MIASDPRCVCPKCGGYKARSSTVCQACVKPFIRQAVVPDEAILTALEGGITRADDIMTALDLKSKTNLMRRLRLMRDAGLVTIVERKRCEGFTITSNRNPDV